MNQSDMSLWGVICVFRRHRHKMLCCFGVVLAATAVTIGLAPRSYQSEATLLVRLGRENVGLDPTVTLGESKTINLSQSRAQEINTVASILRNRNLLTQVAERVGPEAILNGKDIFDAPDGAEPNVSPGTGLDSTETGANDGAARRLEKSIRVEPIKDSNLVRVVFESPDPALSQRVVDILIDCYLTEHARIHRTPGAHQFLADQTTKLREELGDAEGRLRELKTDTGLVAPSEQGVALVQRIETIKTSLLEVEAQTATTEAELENMRNWCSQIPETEVILDVEGVPSNATDQMRSQLYALELEGEKLRGTRTDEHPLVKSVLNEIAGAKAILAEAEQPRNQQTLGPNRVRKEAELELVRKESLLHALTVQKKAFERQLGDTERELQEFNENELRVADLEREVGILDASYREYAAHVERARIDRSLDAARMTNITVIQPASLDLCPVFPNKPLTFVAGLLVAVLASGGIAFAAESFENRAKMPAMTEERDAFSRYSHGNGNGSRPLQTVTH